jgi:stage III sporulation protein AD
MDIIWKAIGGTLVAVVLGLVLGKRNPDISAVLSLCVCCMLLASAMYFLKPVVALIAQLGTLSGVKTDILEILTKAVALSLVSQIASMLCTDAGNSALGKGIEIAAVCAILWTAIPLFSGMIQLVNDIISNI